MFSAVAAACALVFPQHAGAQYPQKPVQLVVPFVAGGTPDFIARVLEPGLSSQLGQRVFIDNRPGAGGLIGTEFAARAAPDGHTLVVGGNTTFCVTPALQHRNKRYDVMEDFVHIALLAEAQLLLVSHPSLPARNIRSLVTLAKRHPGKLTYASSGNGTSPHILGELFKHATGLGVQHVPYRGGPQAWTAVISGEVALAVGQVNQAMPHLGAGRVRAYAVFGGKRSPALPDIPTFQESGIEGLRVSVWYSLATPARTPPAIVNRLNTVVNASLSAPDVKAALHRAGLTAYSATVQETTGFVRAEIPRWLEAVRISGAKVD
ncbi:MAG: tripartite tricarboxylate transporter substrate binding protein [Burkholderiales bacterium]|nr:tripartite tricarboxylate transporter substrate binding protein [Burkholderiales bacterium]